MRKTILSFLCIGCLYFTIAAKTANAGLTNFEYKGWDFDLGAVVIVDMYNTHNSKEVPNGLDHSTNDTTFEGGDDSCITLKFKNDKWDGAFRVRALSIDRNREPLHWYWMQYDFEVAKFLVGRNRTLTYNPLLLPPPMKSGIAQMAGHTAAPQLRLTFPLGSSGLEWAIAALQPDDYVKSKANGGRVVTGAVEDTHVLPSLETRLDIPLGNATFAFIAAYEDYTEVSASNKEYDFPSYLFGMTAKYRISSFLLEFSAYKDHNNYSHNGNPRQKGYSWRKSIYGDAYISEYYGDPKYDADTDSIIESDYLGYAIGVNYFLTDWLSLHAGFSQGCTEDDEGNEDPALGYEFFADFKISKHLHLTPFINVTDWQDRTPIGEASIDEGKTTLIGMETCIAFW